MFWTLYRNFHQLLFRYWWLELATKASTTMKPQIYFLNLILQVLHRYLSCWGPSFLMSSFPSLKSLLWSKDHVYRMWKVEGRCTQLTSSSLHTYIIIGWHKSIVSSDWSDTMVWFGQILLYLSFTILYIWSLVVAVLRYRVFMWKIL